MSSAKKKSPEITEHDHLHPFNKTLHISSSGLKSSNINSLLCFQSTCTLKPYLLLGYKLTIIISPRDVSLNSNK